MSTTTDRIPSPFAGKLGSHKPHHLGGDHWTFKFDNGFGASVVRFRLGEFGGSYGAEAGKWELGVLDATGALTYDTPVTDDVIGWQSEDDIAALLDQIAALSTDEPS